MKKFAHPLPTPRRLAMTKLGMTIAATLLLCSAADAASAETGWYTWSPAVNQTIFANPSLKYSQNFPETLRCGSSIDGPEVIRDHDTQRVILSIPAGASLHLDCPKPSMTIGTPGQTLDIDTK